MRKDRTRWIPTGYREAFRDDVLGAVAYISPLNARGKFSGIAYSGKRAKSDWHYSFRNENEAARTIKEWVDGLKAAADYRAKRDAEYKATGRGLEVGDVLRSMWGYEQTQTEWYEVTKVLGKSKVEIRQLQTESYETGWAQGKCVPLIGQYHGEPMVRMAKGGRVRIHSSSVAHVQKPEIDIGGAKTYGAAHFSSYH